MRIAMITGDNPYMLEIPRQLAENHEIVAVFHQKPKKRTFMEQIKRFRKLAAKYGAGYVLLWMLGRKSSDQKLQPGYQEGNERLNHVADYGKIDRANVHYLDDVNSPEGVERIKAVNPDVVICHGGPIYKKLLISSVKLILNFHSGISPVYNGGETHMFAFANKQPHFCGGTLMVMNEKVDGGDILAHVLPAIEAGDHPGRLFLKGLQGAVKLYDHFLTHLENNGTYVQVVQPPPVFYYKAMDWTVYHQYEIQHALNENLSAKYVRDEKLVEYWRCNTPEEAAAALKEQLTELLFQEFRNR